MIGARRIAAAVVALALAACASGGAARLSFPFTEVAIDASPDLRLAARREWTRAGVGATSAASATNDSISTSATAAEWNLSLTEVLEEIIDERDDDGAVDAYLLRYRLTYDLRARAQKPLTAGVLEAEIVVDYSPSYHHAYRREKDRAVRDLRRELLARVVSLADDAARERRSGE